VTVTATSSDPTIVPNPTVTGTGATRTLSYQPVANANGTVTITVTANDGQPANNITTRTFTITVTPVNDAPSFMKGADQSIFASAGAQTVPGWATALSTGPANESAQTLDFLVSNNNNAIFAVQPVVSATGTLTYSPKPGVGGTATVTVMAHDNGGTLNGGIDTSAAQTFTIKVSVADSTSTTLTSSAATSTFGQSVTLTATVANTTGTGTPTGSVEFFDNQVSIGTAALTNGTASFPTTKINAGTRSITATYTPTGNFLGSTSPAVTVTVSQAAAGTTALAITPLTVQYSDKPTFTATYTPPAAGAPIPTTVNFKIGTDVLGSAPLVLVGTQYQATWSGQLLESTPTSVTVKPGAKTVVAATVDPNFVASSGSRPMTINKEDARVAYTGPTAPKLGGQIGTVVLTASIKDITAVTGDAAWDANGGDISKAQVQFVDRGTNITLGVVDVVRSADPTVGTATFNWSVDLGTAASKAYTIGFIVTNYYNRNQTVDNVTVTVSK
jgi:hypothetical protein